MNIGQRNSTERNTIIAPENKRKQVNSLVLLRGIAALTVVFCHFGNPLKEDPNFGNIFNFFHDYGLYGVQMFFVISGFVIPLSLDRSNYKLSNYLNFLKKRALRLHPPYMAALIITLVVSYLAYKSKGLVYPENLLSITKSFFYLHFPADNPVFWTLGVEVTYYFFIGLLFPVFKKYPLFAVIALIPLFSIISKTIVVDYVNFFNFTMYFFIGIFGYFIYEKQSLTLNYAGLALSIIASFYFNDLIGTIVAIFTIAFIFFYNLRVPKFFNFLGEISYSVYLIHFVIGLKFINLSIRYVNPSLYWALFIVAIIFIYAVSYVFYRIIEIPSAKLSNKVKYRKRPEEN
jgi:peptidoglycan/LPS O-acetylase OafA/YrhL